MLGLQACSTKPTKLCLSVCMYVHIFTVGVVVCLNVLISVVKKLSNKLQERAGFSISESLDIFVV